MTTALGSPPVWTLAVRVLFEVWKMDSELSCGLTIATSLSSSVIATVSDFDGRLSTAPLPGAS